ncbi:MAG: Nif3-like dinuclear metal center hexameric protein [bacterium]
MTTSISNVCFERFAAAFARTLPDLSAVSQLGRRVANMLGLDGAQWTGDGDRMVRKVAVLPGSGRSLIDRAAGACEVLVTGDLSHHDAERAGEAGLSLIAVPHGDFEWWAFRRWAETLGDELAGSEVTVSASREWRSPWEGAGGNGVPAVETTDDAAAGENRGLRLWIDGGSRGNPGPSAIGVVLEDGSGTVLDSVSRVIGVATNNVAEYRALLTGLQMAERSGGRELDVFSDSELLVKQMRGDYRVKNEGLKPLHEEARRLVAGFDRVSIRHVGREENARADGLVNQALDEAVPS